MTRVPASPQEFRLLVAALALDSIEARWRRLTVTLAAMVVVVVSLPAAQAGAAPTDPLLPPVTNTERPTISGTPQVGEVLTASPGTWDPEPTEVTYEWLTDGAVIPGAISQTYTVRPEDVGHSIAVRVTAHKELYESGTATSDPTAPVTAPPEPPCSAGCTETRTRALAPGHVDRGERAAVCGRVGATSGSSLASGTLRLTVHRERGSFSVTKELRFAGGTRCMKTRRLAKRGRYTVTAQYRPRARSDFSASSGSAGLRVGGTSKVRPGDPDRSLMVIGDSLARAYGDQAGSPREGFWSMVAREVRAEPRVVAQGGSGFVKPGLSRCKGRNFLEQLSRPSVRERFAQAGAVIVEGGRNDTRVCTGHGHFSHVSTAELRRAVDAFMDEAQQLRGKDDCTIVVTPWGPKGADERARITPVIRRSARRHGFTFVDTVGLLDERTTQADGVHPNRAGNRAVSDAILSDSFARACFY